MQRKIYVASSWRNPAQPEVVSALRSAGHLVYDTAIVRIAEQDA